MTDPTSTSTTSTTDPTASTIVNSTVASIIRTAVPYVAGVILAWLVSANLTIPGVSEPVLEGLLTFAFGTIWYVVVRALEKKWPKLGWLLGAPVQPTYTKN